MKRILTLLSFVMIFALTSCGEKQEVKVATVHERCADYLLEEQEALLVKLYRKRIPVLYTTYGDILVKQKQARELRTTLHDHLEALHDEKAKNIIRTKLQSLEKHSKSLEQSVRSLEARAFEMALVNYALKVAPATLDDDTQRHLGNEVQQELEFAEQVMGEIDALK